MKHTKGKWSIEKVNSENSLVYAKINVENKSLGYTGVYNGHGKISESECLANAKLISKAPEMYEALKKLADFKSTENPDFDMKLIGEIIEIQEGIIKEIES